MVLGRNLLQAHENPVADGEGGVVLGGHVKDAGFGGFALPVMRRKEQVAIGIDLSHAQDGDGREAVRIGRAAASLAVFPFGFQFLEGALEVDAGGALDAERLGDVALGGGGGVVGEPVEDLGFGGEDAHGVQVALGRRIHNLGQA